MKTKKNNQQKNAQTSNDFYTLTCPTDLFRFFLRKNYKEIKIDNEDCDELGKNFYKYLRSLNFTEEQKKNVLPKNTFDVMLNANHRVRINGFSAAYLLHFTQFLKQEKEGI